MTLLVVSPDYASHLFPLASLATAWRDAGERVVVATGPATASIVSAFGYERADLRLGRGSNAGVIRAEEQPAGEDDSLRGFFAATRRGMVETLAYQATERLTDLLYEPVRAAADVARIVDAVAPDAVLVDHLAFSARLGLSAAQAPYADVVLGHPTALPVGDEVYGYPPAWPAAFSPDPEALAALHALCAEVDSRFTGEWNAALAEIAPNAPAVVSAFRAHGETVLLNYPAAFAEPGRLDGLRHAFLGSAVREEAADPEVEAWLAAGGGPFVYVSFGSFLSERADVLARVMWALAGLGLRAAIATGSADPAALPTPPAGWLVREFLPQVRLLGFAAAAVTHGGNNSVTEAATAGVPLVVLPFSTDQFAGAAALERFGVAVALAPNEATTDDLRAAIERVLDPAMRSVLEPVSADLRQAPGALRAFEAVSGTITS
ncbi:MAG TPA: glycosyltransferase [Amnibacterium sp.]|jgi:MGT family glycosyltransferase|uniref:glycosyltransferase n=1 Tax=Amnibacterium sp. TaxID=1872496 RepID=UPI002F95889E